MSTAPQRRLDGGSRHLSNLLGSDPAELSYALPKSTMRRFDASPCLSLELPDGRVVTSADQRPTTLGADCKAIGDVSIEVANLQLVVPAINEEDRIGRTVRRLCEHLAGRTWTSELIVVDNGSADTTAEVVDRHHRDLLTVEVIGCSRRGKGAAVRQGFLHSTAEWVGYCDADLSTPPDAIDDAVALLEEGWDIVVGSRRCPGGAYLVPQPPLRRAGSAAFHLLAQRLVGSIADTQCGFKLFRGDIGRELFSNSTVAGFAFDVEILGLAARRGLKIVEMPVAWADQKGSTFRPITDGFRVVRDLASVRRVLSEATDY